MSEQEQLTDLRRRFSESGEYLVGDDTIPTGSCHVLVLGAKKGLDADVIADWLLTYFLIAAFPLPGYSEYPYLYFFIIYKSNVYGIIKGESTDIPLPGITVSEVEEGFALNDSQNKLGVRFVAVQIAGVVITNPDYNYDTIISYLKSVGHQALNDGMSTGGAVIYNDNESIPEDSWVILRVHVLDRPPLSTRQIKQLLEVEGYKVIAPDIGIVGALVSSTDVITPNMTSVFFNANGHKVTADLLYNQVFEQFGFTVPAPGFEDLPPRAKVIPALYTKPNLINSQDLANFIWSGQQLTGTVIDVGAAGVDTTADLLAALNKVLIALPKLLYVAVGGVVLYGLWRAFKLIKDAPEVR